jgi:hypothetical protein
MRKNGVFVSQIIQFMKKIDFDSKKFKKLGYEMGNHRINEWLNTFHPSTKIL